MEELLKDLDGAMAEAILQRHQDIVKDYEGRIREGHLKQAVTAAGGHNYIAIRALVGELPQDENDAKAAVAKVRRDNPYLFGAGAVYSAGAGRNRIATGYTMEELGKLSPAEYRRYRKGM